MICIWAVAGREAVQHAVSDVGWRLGRRDSGLDLDEGGVRVTLGLRAGLRRPGDVLAQDGACLLEPFRAF